MGILQRFKTIMSSNVHAILNENGNAGKKVKSHLTAMEKDFGTVKAELTALISQEQRVKRAIEECIADSNKMQRYAEKSVENGMETDARGFLDKKESFLTQKLELEKAHQLAVLQRQQLQQMENKLAQDMEMLTSQAAGVSNKTAAGNLQNKMNKIGSITDESSLLGKANEDANTLLDEANALAELRGQRSKEDLIEAELVKLQNKLKDEV